MVADYKNDESQYLTWEFKQFLEQYISFPSIISEAV